MEDVVGLLCEQGHGAVVVVPMQDDETVLLVREYAAGMHRYELGLVKGRIDAGETPEQAEWLITLFSMIQPLLQCVPISPICSAVGAAH